MSMPLRNQALNFISYQIELLPYSSYEIVSRDITIYSFIQDSKVAF